MSGITRIVQTQRIIVNPTGNRIAITNAGPVGPGGPPGIDGGMTGEIRMWAGGSIPVSWEECDFGELSRIENAALFAQIGTSWGVGNGSTTFNKPDLRGRGPIGAGTGPGLTVRSVGQKVGVEDVTLSASQSGLVGHNHTQNAHSHLQNPHYHTVDPPSTDLIMPGTLGGSVQRLVNDYSGGGAQTAPIGNLTTVGGNGSYAYTNIGVFDSQTVTATNIARTAINVAATSASAADAHPNVQPSAVVIFIIKT